MPPLPDAATGPTCLPRPAPSNSAPLSIGSRDLAESFPRSQARRPAKTLPRPRSHRRPRRQTCQGQAVQYLRHKIAQTGYKAPMQALRPSVRSKIRTAHRSCRCLPPPPARPNQDPERTGARKAARREGIHRRSFGYQGSAPARYQARYQKAVRPCAGPVDQAAPDAANTWPARHGCCSRWGPSG